MQEIMDAESKEARRTMPGYSKEAYASIAAQVESINVTDSDDRRLFFELTGHKLTVDGRLIPRKKQKVGGAKTWRESNPLYYRK